MCIRDSYHNCGVGTKLLNKVIEEIGLPLGLKCLEVNQKACLLYTSDAADERSSVDLGGRRIIKKKK